MASAHAKQTRSYFVLLFGLAATHVVLVFALPVLPAQDLPQHLAYARILLDYDDPTLLFAQTYELPAAFQSYFTAHYALAGLGAIFDVEAAARILYAAYAVTFMGAFHYLVRAARGRRDGEPPWVGLLGAGLVVNPISVLGFLAFTLALPALVAAMAACIHAARGDRRAQLTLAALGAYVGVMHAFAAACLVLLVAVFALFAWRARPLIGGLAAIVVACACAALGEAGLGDASTLDVADAARRAHGVGFFSRLVHAEWSGSTASVNHVLWSAVGPYRPTVLVGAGALVFGAAVFGRGGVRGLGRAVRRALRPRAWTQRAAIALFVIGWVAPFGVHAPTELTYLNLRLTFLAVVLLIATFGVRVELLGWRPRIAVAALALASVTCFGVQAGRFGAEADDALALLERTDAGAPLLSVVHHDRTAGFARQFRLTHFLPMYFTVRRGGRATQFWGRYTHHLPVAIREGREIPHPPDWQPGALREHHLRGVGWALVQYASRSEDPEPRRRASARSHRVMRGSATELECRGLWCVYRVDGSPAYAQRGGGRRPTPMEVRR